MAAFRLANIYDLKTVEKIVDEAYSVYVDRIGKPPAPMLEDYENLIQRHLVHVIEDENEIQGIIVLIPKDNYMLLENVAVKPSSQSRGYGGRLLSYAYEVAKKMGYKEIHLYTHEKMVENQEMYRHLGWKEYKRQTDKGYNRVYMLKKL